MVRACIAATPTICRPSRQRADSDTDSYLNRHTAGPTPNWDTAPSGHTDGSVKFVAAHTRAGAVRAAGRAGTAPTALHGSPAGSARSRPHRFPIPGRTLVESANPRGTVCSGDPGATGPRETRTLRQLDNGFLPDDLTAQPAFGDGG